MINPFTLQHKVTLIQEEVLAPLYTMYDGQEEATHDWLLVLTGRVIDKHKRFIEELCASRFVAAVFKIVKLLGGAEKLTEKDFKSFTSYVGDGGITAMVKMLLSSDKKKTFVKELSLLPPDVRSNASAMLNKSAELHNDFILGYFKENYKKNSNIPTKLRSNFKKSQEFIVSLACLAERESKKS